MSRDLIMICPSRGRPDNAAELVRTWRDVTDSAALLIVADDDDPTVSMYRQIGAMVISAPRRLGPILNVVSYYCVIEGADAVGFLGDDHRPRTEHWDTMLMASLEDAPGVAYGDDLIQHENLPTAVVMSAEIIRGLGYMCPAGVMHLYLDDFWKLVGTELGALHYRSDVVIEHMHPGGGKAEWDDLYRERNSPRQSLSDSMAYAAFLASNWPADLARLREHLNGMETVRRPASGSVDEGVPL